MKIEVDYNQSTGMITMPDGAQYYTIVGMSYPGVGQGGTGNTVIIKEEKTVDKLVDRGMTADELIKLRRAGVI